MKELKNWTLTLFTGGVVWNVFNVIRNWSEIMGVAQQEETITFTFAFMVSFIIMLGITMVYSFGFALVGILIKELVKDFKKKRRV
jgi:hypothetical protein